MFEFLQKLFSSDFMPHGHCYLWQPQIVWLHVISDSLISLAYYSIPIMLIHFVRKRPDIGFNWVFWMFGAFILACGTTHVMSIWTMWVPMYRLDGLVKVITAILSIGTAVMLVPVVPLALARPSPAQLEAANRELQSQISERHKAEQALSQLNAELETRVMERTSELARSNEELQRFAYVASHDLKEPLRMVSSYLQLISKRYQGRIDADGDAFIGYAVEGATRMKELLDGLLECSRVDTAGSSFDVVESGTALQRAVDILQVEIDETDGRVTHGEMPQVMADQVQLVQVFQNLIGNALKFHVKGREPRVHVQAEVCGGEWRFSVSDQGIGIDPKHAEEIFHLYQRLHTREEYPGMGIGLAICKRIVERHGGRIWVDPRAGGGSVFSFTLVRPGERAHVV